MSLISFIKLIHIICGGTALLSGALAIGFRSHVKRHKPFGKVYFLAMTFVFVTSVYMGLVKKNVFLICVGFFTYYMCITAFRSLKLKKIPDDQRPGAFDWIIELVFGLAHLFFVLLSVWFFMQQQISAAVIGMVFGLIGLRMNYSTYKRFTRKSPFANQWLLTHIGNMLGSYIGAFTAFLVNNGGILPLPPIALWLLPTMVFTPLIFLEIRKRATKLVE